MIFSIICEEFGLAGAGFLIFLFLLLLWRFFVIAVHAKDLFGALIVSGAMAHRDDSGHTEYCRCHQCDSKYRDYIAVCQLWGTSIVFLLAEMGLVLNVSTMVRQKKRKELLGGRQMERERNARRRKNAKKKKQAQRIYALVVLISGLAIIIMTVLLLFHIQRIEVKGNEYCSDRGSGREHKNAQAFEQIPCIWYYSMGWEKETCSRVLKDMARYL